MNRFRVLNSDSLLCLTFLFLMGTANHAQEFQSWNEVDLSASWRHVDFLAPFVAAYRSRLAESRTCCHWAHRRSAAPLGLDPYTRLLVAEPACKAMLWSICPCWL